MTISKLLEKSRRPFPAHPCVESYFPAASSEQARERLARAIERGDGPGLLIGATGTGKSLLLQVLAEQFRSRFDIAALSCGQLCTRRALLQAILFELGLPYRYHDEGELRLTLLDHLLPNERCPNGVLLLVDEAQSLPARLLEEIRLITNLVRDGQPRARLVLAGSPNLEELFTSPELESLQQRIAARCYLAPLGQAETESYVRAHLAAVSSDSSNIFDPEALSSVFQATDGVPRLVNQLCDAALLISVRDNSPRVHRSAVQEAWADLQQLPTPWETEPAALSEFSEQNVVEFGQLADAKSTDDAVDAVGDDEFADAVEVDPCAIVLSSDRISPSNEDFVAPELDTSTEGFVNSDWIVASAPQNENIVEEGLANRDDDCASTSKNNNENEQRVQLTTGDFGPSANDAADPFQEEFGDEELVLDSFSTTGDTFRAETPRVANQGDDGLSAMVRDVIEARKEQTSVRERENLARDQPDEEDASDAEHQEPLDSVPLISLAADSTSKLIVDYDPVYPEESPYQNETDEKLVATEEIEEIGSSVTLKYPTASETHPNEFDVPVLPTPGECESKTLDDSPIDILVVEDVPMDESSEEPDVCQMEYGQLFAKLRGG